MNLIEYLNNEITDWEKVHDMKDCGEICKSQTIARIDVLKDAIRKIEAGEIDELK